uniref:Uncharacterized protein n=1 Tax=Anguilla anguilla TaxID=7936 RepID=A0A0E9VDZ5_ANGAN
MQNTYNSSFSGEFVKPFLNHFMTRNHNYFGIMSFTCFLR